MLRRGLSREIRNFLLFVGAIAFVGYGFDLFEEALILALMLYCVWTFRQLHRLERWVFRTRNGHNPENHQHGIWGEIGEDVKLLCNRHDKERLRLQAIVTRVQDMTAALHDGVLLTDRRANIEWWNPAARTLLGLRDIDLGHRITNILREPAFQQYFDAGDYRDPLQMSSHRNHERQLLLQIHFFGLGERLIIVRDITRVAKLEQMRRDFVANVSHELRTPLTVIRGYVETLIDMPQLPPVAQRAFVQMQQQGMRMTALVNDLITLTKLETDDRKGHDEHVQLHNLVVQVLSDGRVLGSEKHYFYNEIDRRLQLQGSEKELRSAISNLVVNAVKYSPEGCNVRVYSDKTGNAFQLHVQDSGPGIDPKHIPRLTERFYRVDSGRSSTAGGTGLGLAIVKHVLLRHDATLKITSYPGKGSTFSCCFPLERLSEGDE